MLLLLTLLLLLLLKMHWIDTAPIRLLTEQRRVDTAEHGWVDAAAAHAILPGLPLLLLTGMLLLLRSAHVAHHEAHGI